MVKKGSKIRSRVLASMPVPVSLTASITYRPGGDASVHRRVARVELDVGRLDRELAAARHRVARVDDEVHEDLLDLPGIGLHGAEVEAAHDRQLDVLAEEAAQHLLDAADRLVEVEDPRLEDLLPAERQELPRQLRGASAGAADLLEVVPHRIPGLEARRRACRCS